jgi:hypothetical protein
MASMTVFSVAIVFDLHHEITINFKNLTTLCAIPWRV